MKLDHYELVVRENGDTGDSMAETCRVCLLADESIQLRTHWFTTPFGLVRHPDSLWPESDMSNDQFIPLLMADGLLWVYVAKPLLFIPGTKTLLQPAAFALVWRQWWLLRLCNWVQGLLLALPFRWSDDDSEGHGFRSSKNKVQDYLNMIVIWHFLNQRGVKAKLPRPARECYWAVWRYYARGKDPEPNSKWVRRLYFEALKTPYQGR